MADLGSLFALAQSGTQTVAAFSALVTKKTQVGILEQEKDISNKGFLFHIYGEDSVTLSSDITDHFVEDNSTIQDQIALRPETVTVHGFIAEVNTKAQDVSEFLASAKDKLTSLSAFAPGLTAKATTLYNSAALAVNTASQLTKYAKSALGGAVQQNAQQQAFGQFYSWWITRQLFHVQTPWSIFDNMVIQTIRTSQSDTNNVISEFEITFKAMRFANTQTIKASKNAKGRLQAMAFIPSDKGAQVNTNNLAFPFGK